MEISGSRLANHPPLAGYPAQERPRGSDGVTKGGEPAASRERRDSALTERVVHGELLEKGASVDYGELLGRARAQAQGSGSGSRFRDEGETGTGGNRGPIHSPYVQGALSAYQSNTRPSPPVSPRRVDTYV